MMRVKARCKPFIPFQLQLSVYSILSATYLRFLLIVFCYELTEIPEKIVLSCRIRNPIALSGFLKFFVVVVQVGLSSRALCSNII